MALYKDFQPTTPRPTPEEKRYAYDKWHEAHNRGEETPEDVLEIWRRSEQVAMECGEFMRSDTSEIVAKMLPEGTPLTIERMMDILHVYYWWSLDEPEPVECFESFVEDLNDERFAEAVEVLHEEFRDQCERYRLDNTLEGDQCESPSGMECFQWCTDLNDKTEKVLASPHKRADRLNMMFFEALYGDDDDYAETPYDLEDPDETFDNYPMIMNRQPDTHTLRLMLGQHAIRQLTEAGVGDIEAMDAIAVIELEKQLRDYGGGHASYEKYERFRDKGGDFEGYLRKVSRVILNDEGWMETLIEDFVDSGTKLSQLSKAERKAIVQRYIDEEFGDFESLETLHLLKKEGISPFYRRRMAEDLFPQDQRV